MAVQTRRTESMFEIIADAKPYGPPLTSAEHMLRGALIAAFLALLGAEGWFLWHLWSLWR
jgi:hypothetical protein